MILNLHRILANVSQNFPEFVSRSLECSVSLIQGHVYVFCHDFRRIHQRSDMQRTQPYPIQIHRFMEKFQNAPVQVSRLLAPSGFAGSQRALCLRQAHSKR